jgi:hypothetical protein
MQLYGMSSLTMSSPLGRLPDEIRRPRLAPRIVDGSSLGKHARCVRANGCGSVHRKTADSQRSSIRSDALDLRIILDPVKRAFASGGSWPELPKAAVSFHDAQFGRQLACFEIELATVRARPSAVGRRPQLTTRKQTAREPGGHALALRLKMWMVSPRASISTNWAMRLARVSAFTAVCMRHSTA